MNSETAGIGTISDNVNDSGNHTAIIFGTKSGIGTRNMLISVLQDEFVQRSALGSEIGKRKA